MVAPSSVPQRASRQFEAGFYLAILNCGTGGGYYGSRLRRAPVSDSGGRRRPFLDRVESWLAVISPLRADPLLTAPRPNDTSRSLLRRWGRGHRHAMTAEDVRS